MRPSCFKHSWRHANLLCVVCISFLSLNAVPSCGAGIESCPNAAWKDLLFLQAPVNSSYFNAIDKWKQEQVQSYVKDKVIPAIVPSLAFLGLGLLGLLLFVIWRIARCCLSCCSTAPAATPRESSASSEPAKVLKGCSFWSIKLLLLLPFALATCALTVYGMTKVNLSTVPEGWNAFNVSRAYAAIGVEQVDLVASNASRSLPIISTLQYIAVDVVQLSAFQVNITATGQLLDTGNAKAMGLIDTLEAARTDLIAINASLANLVTSVSQLDSGMTGLQAACTTISTSQPLLTGIGTTLATLQAALAAIPGAEPGTQAADPRIQALNLALQGVTPSSWGSSLDALIAAMDTWDANRSPTSPLARIPTDLTALQASIARAKSNTLPPLSDALIWFDGAGRKLVDVTDGMLERMKVINTSVVLLEGGLGDVYSLISKANTQLHEVANLKPSAKDVAQVLNNLTATTLELPAEAATLLTTAVNAYQALLAVSTMSTYKTYAQNLKASIQALEPPHTSCSAATTAYILAPGAGLYAALPATIPAATTAVAQAVTAVNPGASAAAIATPQVAAGTAATTLTPLKPLVSAQATVLQQLQAKIKQMVPTDMYASYLQPLRDVRKALADFPDRPSKVLEPISSALGTFQSSAIGAGDQAKAQINSAMKAVGQASDQVRGNVVYRMDDIRYQYQEPTEHWGGVLLKVLLAIMGSCLFCLAVLVFTVALNCPAGLVLSLLAVHIMCCIYFFIALIAAGALSVTKDVCPAVESVVIQQVPLRYKPLARYYLSGESRNVSLQTVLADSQVLDLRDLDSQVKTLQNQVSSIIYKQFTPVGLLKQVLRDVNDTIDATMASKNNVLAYLSEPQFKAAYTTSKGWSCCTLPGDVSLFWYVFTIGGWLLLVTCCSGWWVLTVLDRFSSCTSCTPVSPRVYDTSIVELSLAEASKGPSSPSAPPMPESMMGVRASAAATSPQQPDLIPARWS